MLPLWWIGVNSISGVTNMAANLALHAAGIAVLLLVLLSPRWRGALIAGSPSSR